MKRLLIPFVLTLAPALLVTSTSLAADHYDAYEGDFVKSDNYRHHDIVDLFTFPKTDKAGTKLVMVMNTYNRANALSSFDDKLSYSFRVREGAATGKGDEYRFTCTFDVPAEGKKQEATCNAFTVTSNATGNGRTAKSVFASKVAVDYVVPVTGDATKMRVFAGRRADAFFGDAAGLGVMLEGHRIPDTFRMADTNTGPRNLTALADDLSIAIEVDMKALFGTDQTVFRVAAETGRKRTSGGK